MSCGRTGGKGGRLGQRRRCRADTRQAQGWGFRLEEYYLKEAGTGLLAEVAFRMSFPLNLDGTDKSDPFVHDSVTDVLSGF